MVSSTQENFYVYTHHHVETGEIFYVGKGTRRRAWNVSSRSETWKSASGGRAIVHIIFDKISEDLALYIERMLISMLGIDTLANKTLGGGGASGYKHSDTWKSILSDRMTGCFNPMTGMIGDKNPFYGKQHSDEAKRKMSRPRPSVSMDRNPSADNSIYEFVHKDHGFFVGTRYELSKSFGVPLNLIRKAITGRSAKGWILANV